MPGSLHIFFKIPKIGSVFDCLALLSKKVKKLLCDILITWSPKASKKQVIKWDEKLNSQASMVSQFSEPPVQASSYSKGIGSAIGQFKQLASY